MRIRKEAGAGLARQRLGNEIFAQLSPPSRPASLRPDRRGHQALARSGQAAYNFNY